MAGLSSNPTVMVEVADEYPYPSHVFVPNFVTVKLSGRDDYNLWKTQMRFLLVSHGMVGFVDGTFVSPTDCAQSSVAGKKKVGDVDAWRRSDALVIGWILGSISEHVARFVMSRLNNFTAKNVWDELQRQYGDAVLINHMQLGREEVRITREAQSIVSEDAKAQGNINIAPKYEAKNEAQLITKIHEKLYEATLRGSWEDVDDILKTEEVRATEKISINGNTALHVAVGTTRKTEFIEKMLNLIPESTLVDMRNADGSTVLHVAATVGNTDAAMILVARNPDLLAAEDHHGFTPLARALSNMHTDTYLNLLQCSTNAGTRFASINGDELLVNAISSTDFDSAKRLMYANQTFDGYAALMAITQNYPSDVRDWEISVYSLMQIPLLGHHDEESDTNMCVMLIFILLLVAVFWPIKFLIWMGKVWPFRLVEERAKSRLGARDMLFFTCDSIKCSSDPSYHDHYYNNPILEAARINAYEVVEIIVSYFPNAIWSVNEYGHNIIQTAVINRSEEVYNLLYQMSEHKNIYRTIKDSYGENLLHMAGRLAPTDKLNRISGAALQIQRELQWFKEVEGFVCPINKIQKNSFGETPQMVFTREHKDLVTEGEKWMKATAESYTITAALITTIVFAAAITVPGGNNQDTGIPVFTNDTAFTIFAASDAISLFMSTTSLLMFLSILTARFSEQDFLFKLPRRLIIGLATLFISTTAMIVAFGATLFLVFGQKKPWILGLIATLTCLPITSFVTLQFPLIADLMIATYGRSIFGKKRNYLFY